MTLAPAVITKALLRSARPEDRLGSRHPSKSTCSRLMKKFRLCYILDTFWSLHAGTEKHLIELVNRLDRDLFEVHLCCLYTNDHFPVLQDVLKDCRVKIFNYNGLPSYRIPFAIKDLAHYLKEKRIDIVHTFFIDSVYVGTLAAKLSRVKIVITSRRSMGYSYSMKDVFLLRIFNKLATSVCVNSRAVKEMVIKREGCPENRIHVIYNGINLEPFVGKGVPEGGVKGKLGIINGELIIGMVANVRPVKRIETFLDALYTLKGDDIKFKAVIVGDVSLTYGKRMTEYTEQLGLSEDVIYTGEVTEVIPYLQSFDLAVLTSDSEGFSNSVLEYMAAGLPIIATATGGNIEMLAGSKNSVIPVGDYSALADAIRWTLFHKEKRTEMGVSSLDKVSAYEWKTVIKTWHSYYLSLLSASLLT